MYNSANKLSDEIDDFEILYYLWCFFIILLFIAFCLAWFVVVFQTSPFLIYSCLQFSKAIASLQWAFFAHHSESLVVDLQNSRRSGKPIAVLPVAVRMVPILCAILSYHCKYLINFSWLVSLKKIVLCWPTWDVCLHDIVLKAANTRIEL